MSKLAALEISLYGQPIGQIVHLPRDKNYFSFYKEYIQNVDRPTLSLSFKDNMGDLITNIKSTRTKLPPFFSNLFPEGPIRNYLTSKAKLSQSLVLETARDTVQRFTNIWQSISDFSLDDQVIKIINNHLETISIYKEGR